MGRPFRQRKQPLPRRYRQDASLLGCRRWNDQASLGSLWRPSRCQWHPLDRRFACLHQRQSLNHRGRCGILHPKYSGAPHSLWSLVRSRWPDHGSRSRQFFPLQQWKSCFLWQLLRWFELGSLPPRQPDQALGR